LEHICLDVPLRVQTSEFRSRIRAGSGCDLVVRLVGQFLHEQRQVTPGELPFEGDRCPFVAALEGSEAVRDLGKVFEVVGREDLSVDNC
jgi:hypothetical protein